VEVELLQNVPAMGLDRMGTQAENRGDLFVGLALRNQLQDLALARGQEVVGILHFLFADLTNVIFQQHFADHGAEARLTFGNGADRADEVGLRGIFQDVSARAGFQGAKDVALVGVHAEDHHIGMRFLSDDLPGSFNSIQLRHADVENHDIGVMPGNKLDGLPSILSFGRHFEIGLALEQEPQTGSNDVVIVGEDDADLSHELILRSEPISGEFLRQRRSASGWRNRRLALQKSE